MFPTEMFTTTTQRKILRVLSEKNKRYTIEELAEMCHRSEASISRALAHSNRYDFIEKSRVPGTKQLTFTLDSDSQYTSAIRDFFDVEYNRERRNGTIPVDVWNVLEDTTNRFQDALDEFVELFLFGSYATGEYYAGSDIDLLLVHTSTGDPERTIDDVSQAIGDDRLQVLSVQLPDIGGDRRDETIVETVRNQSPVSGVDTLIPLSGKVTL